MVATYEYDAYGNLLKETGNVENPYRYAGYRYDGETGLFYLQSRYYNPETGRFLTRDLIEGDIEDPTTHNKYTYVGNNPIMYFDPDGLRRIKIVNTRVIAKWYLSHDELTDLLTAGAFIKDVLNGKLKRGKLAKQVSKQLLSKIVKYVYVSIGVLWSLSRINGKSGFTITAIQYKQQRYKQSCENKSRWIHANGGYSTGYYSIRFGRHLKGQGTKKTRPTRYIKNPVSCKSPFAR